MLLHPRGIRHLVDPSALQRAVLDIYGAEAVARDYGTLLPVDAARITATEDGMVVHLGRRRLEFAHTPGHAQHHHCLWDEASGGWFTGDTFGVSYREFDSARGALDPGDLDAGAVRPAGAAASVRRLLAKQPRCMYLTHYGRVGDVRAARRRAAGRHRPAGRRWARPRRPAPTATSGCARRCRRSTSKTPARTAARWAMPRPSPNPFRWT